MKQKEKEWPKEDETEEKEKKIEWNKRKEASDAERNRMKKSVKIKDEINETERKNGKRNTYGWGWRRAKRCLYVGEE